MPRGKKSEPDSVDTEKPEATPSVDLQAIHSQQNVAAQVQQDAVANQIAGGQEARKGNRHIVIGPGGVRFSIEDLHMDVRYPLTRDADMLSDPVKCGLIKPEAHKPGWRYLWPKRLADSTANLVAAGVYEIVPGSDTQPVAGIGIAKVTLPNGDSGVAWTQHILVRMSPEHWDQYVNYWERLSWQRQIKQTKAPIDAQGGVEYTAEIKDRRQETVLIPT